MKMEKTFVIRHKLSGKKLFSFKCLNLKLCVEIAVALKANLESANLRSADLRSANLESANLESADLRYADLRYATLESADLRSANLRSADLRSANLRSANLRSANLESADLESANLRSANLEFSCLPLWCGSLKANFDDKQIKQFLYHVLSGVKNSNNVSKELKRLLLTTDLLTIANEFHRIEYERI